MHQERSLPPLKPFNWPIPKKNLQWMLVNIISINYASCQYNNVLNVYSWYIFRLKRFLKKSSPKPVQLNNSELFQRHSPITTMHESAQSVSSSMLLSEEDRGTNNMDSIPPLPPPMPTLEQLREGFISFSQTLVSAYILVMP